MAAIKSQVVRESLGFAQGKRGQILRREPSARKARGEVWRWKRRGHALARARRTQPGKFLQRPGCPAGPGRRFSVTLTAGPRLRSSGRALSAVTEPGCPGGAQPPSRGATRSGFQPSFYHPAYKNHAKDWRGERHRQTDVAPARHKLRRACPGGGRAAQSRGCFSARPHSRDVLESAPRRDGTAPAAALRHPRPPAAFAPQPPRAVGRGKPTCRTAQGILALQNASVLRPAELPLGFPNELYHLDHLGQVPGQGPLLITRQAAHGKGHRLFPRPPPPARLCRGEEALQHRHPGPRPPPGSRSHPPARAAAMGIQSGAGAPGCPPSPPLARGAPGPGPGPAEGRSAGLRRPRWARLPPLRALSPPPGACSRGEAAAGQARGRRSCRRGAGTRGRGLGPLLRAALGAAGPRRHRRSSHPAKRRGGGTLTLSLP